MNQKVYKLDSTIIDYPIKVDDKLVLFLNETVKLEIPFEYVKSLCELHITNTCIIRLKSGIDEETILEVPLNRMGKAIGWFQSIHGLR